MSLVWFVICVNPRCLLLYFGTVSPRQVSLILHSLFVFEGFGCEDGIKVGTNSIQGM